MSAERLRLRRSVAALLTGSLIATGLVALTVGPASAVAPDCTAAAGPSRTIDNGDGTTSIIVTGEAATATVTIPIGVPEVRIDACGAQGQASVSEQAPQAGGQGGRTTATFATPEAVAGTGATSVDLLVVAGTQAGTVGGGGEGPGPAGNGGGFSGVFTDDSDPLVVAGGGGGGGTGGTGGAGGDEAGADGEPRETAPDGTEAGPGGDGATQTSGGDGGDGDPANAGSTGTDGSAFQGGDGGAATADTGALIAGGGGGGGLFGGGGGGALLLVGGGGGGGSGFLSSRTSGGDTTLGGRAGDGIVVITFATPVAPAFTSSLADDAVVGQPYDSTATVNAVPRATFTIEGAIPPGLTADTTSATNTVRLTGTPTTAGVFTFTIIATNPVGTARQVETITVREAAAESAPASTPVSPPASTSASTPASTPASPPASTPVSPPASTQVSPPPSASPSATTSPQPQTATGRLHAVTPARILDTREGGERVAAGADREVQVTGRGGIPATGVSAVVLNVTVTLGTLRGDLQVYPTGQRPANRTSNLNYFAGQTVPVQVLTGVSPTGRVNLSVNTGSVHAIVDVFGWYGDAGDRVAGSSGYTALQPQRLLDTRNSTPVRAGSDRTVPVVGRLGVPAEATAVVFNATFLGTPANADLSVYPTGDRPANRTSNLNVRRGQTKANAVTSALGTDGSVNLSISQNTGHVVLDVLGYYSQDSRGRFVPLTPARIFDTREDRPAVRAGSDRVVRVGGEGGVPAGAQAAVLSVTGTGASDPVDLQVFPTGNRPVNRTSTINFRPAEAVANVAIATLGTGDTVSLSLSQGSATVILDVLGYITQD